MNERSVLLATALLVVSCLAWLPRPALSEDTLRAAPRVEGPVEVLFGFNLTNITDVNERAETIDFDAAVYMHWDDPRLAYDAEAAGMGGFVPGDYSLSPTVLFQGHFQVAELFEGWRPPIVLANGIGDRSPTNMAIRIWPDGRVEYAETFYAKVEVPMAMRVANSRVRSRTLIRMVLRMVNPMMKRMIIWKT